MSDPLRAEIERLAEAMAAALQQGINAWDSGINPTRQRAIEAMMDALQAWRRRSDPPPSRSAEPEGGERRPKPRIQGEGPCLCEHEDDPRRAHRPDCPARKPNPRPRRTPR